MSTDTLQSPPDASSRQARVRALRERVEQQPGGQLVAPRAEVLALLAPPAREGAEPANGEASRYAQSLLVQHGIRTTPPLTDDVAEHVTLTTSPTFAVQGALAVALVATVVGLTGYWLYGVLFAVVGVAVAVGVALGFEPLRRTLPAGVPRGRLLGAAVGLAAALLVFLVAVLPIRAHRNAIGRARGYVVQADAAIGAGRLKEAQDKLFAAEALVDRPPLIDAVRAHLVVAQVQAALDDQARKQGIYDEAERAFAGGEYRRAIHLARSIPGFANIDQRLRAYRRALRRGVRGG